MSTPITRRELEHRRQRAVAAVAEGQQPATVAKVLGVDRGSVYRWLRQTRAPGGLAAKPLDRPPALSDQQLRQLADLLAQGATRYGWPNDLWTATRVTEVIRRHFGICHHPEHVRKILKRRLGWTSQKPQTKARERDEDGIRHWVEHDFPRIVRQAQARDAHLVFPDESCFQLTPTVRRTLAPRGQTPLVPYWDRRDKISAISAITLSPQRHLPGLYFWLLPDKKNFHGEEVVAFLKQLRQQLRRFTVIWDRNQIHSRSRVVRAYLAEHPEIVVEDFPGYAPELNPDEMVWGWTKDGQLANDAAEDLPALRGRIEAALDYLRQHPYELLDLVEHTELPLAG